MPGTVRVSDVTDPPPRPQEPQRTIEAADGARSGDGRPDRDVSGAVEDRRAVHVVASEGRGVGCQ